MKRFNIFLTALIILFCSLTFLGAREKRVNQLPNGSGFSCANCHTNPSGGGARNNFGSQVESGYLDGSGDVIWNSTLAGLDSDNDSATNGTELQDPGGLWSAGNPDPGNLDLVTNPGDPNSKPTGTMVEEINGVHLPGGTYLFQNYPNPFNPETQIQFHISRVSRTTLQIYNLEGGLVQTILEGVLSPGLHQVHWDGMDDLGQRIPSGIYLCQLKTASFQKTIRMLYLR